MNFFFIPQSEFNHVAESKFDKFAKLALLANMCRLNTLFSVKRAGSGHLGSSFSAMDIVVYLYYRYLNTVKVGIKNVHRDIYFSSKGHDAPGLYAVLYSLGIIAEEKFLKLRRLGGLDGHPNIDTAGLEANTGSLGMGISKAKGMVFGKKIQKRKGQVIVLTGDGEFQEGQNWEAMQACVNQKINNILVIMDHNKVQSDRLLEKTSSLGKIDKKIKSFGWYVMYCDGHDFQELSAALKRIEKIKTKPKFLIGDTIKGKGVSFMEHPRALKENCGFYRWHSGAPDDTSYNNGFNELLTSIKKDFKKYKLGGLNLKAAPVEIVNAVKPSNEMIAQTYGDELVRLAKKNKKIVVLDADLINDCKIRAFAEKYPKRFIECGIAEQDMVSMASGLAHQGLIPIVNSFSAFLSSRANEQIYNAQTENKKIIYACHYAGLIPAGPGKSHQSLRDISLFSVFPNCMILQACNSQEMKMMVDYAINDAKESCMLRINIGQSPRIIELPKNYQLKCGQGIALTEGEELIMFAYGPVMLNEALKASDILNSKNIKLKVVAMPWLNRFDLSWIKKELKNCKKLFILEDHHGFGGLADNLINFLNKNNLLHQLKITKFAVEGFPQYGLPREVLKFHKLDSTSLAERIVYVI